MDYNLIINNSIAIKYFKLNNNNKQTLFKNNTAS